MRKQGKQGKSVAVRPSKHKDLNMVAVVEKPNYYQLDLLNIHTDDITRIEVVDIIESLNTSPHASHYFTYLIRAGKKNSLNTTDSDETRLEDLLKGRYWLNREITRLQQKIRLKGQ